MRAFIAVHFDSAIREKICEACASLRKFVASGKWVSLENLHMTIKFLGEISEEQLPRVKSLLEKCIEGTQPWDAKVKGLGAFPPKGTPRVLWAGVDDPGGRLERIAGALNDALENLSRKEGRPFVPHITVARIRKVSDLPGFKDEIEKNAEREFGEQHLAAIELMKSQLLPSGPEYSVLARVELK